MTRYVEHVQRICFRVVELDPPPRGWYHESWDSMRQRLQEALPKLLSNQDMQKTATPILWHHDAGDTHPPFRRTVTERLAKAVNVFAGSPNTIV